MTRIHWQGTSSRSKAWIVGLVAVLCGFLGLLLPGEGVLGTFGKAVFVLCFITFIAAFCVYVWQSIASVGD